MKMIRMQIANSAFSFFEMGEKAYNEALNKAETDSEAAFYGLLPSIVNLSLSIELFIKSFLEAKREYRIHDLKKLYDAWEGPEKAVIQQAIVQEFAKYRPDFDDNKFVIFLENNKEAFEDWRYYYERGKSADPTFLYCMAKVLNEFAYRCKDALKSAGLLA